MITTSRTTGTNNMNKDNDSYNNRDNRITITNMDKI